MFQVVTVPTMTRRGNITGGRGHALTKVTRVSSGQHRHPTVTAGFLEKLGLMQATSAAIQKTPLISPGATTECTGRHVAATTTAP